MVSGWSAQCSKAGDPMSCKTAGGTARVGTTELEEAGLPVDRSHVPAPPLRRELALLRRPGGPARLRQQPDVLQAGRARARTPRTSGTRCRASTRFARTTSSGTSFRSTASTRTRRTGRCRPSRGSCRLRRTASTRRRSSAPARPTSRISSTRSCGAPTGARPRSSSRGTTGAASTTTSSRRS